MNISLLPYTPPKECFAWCQEQFAEHIATAEIIGPLKLMLATTAILLAHYGIAKFQVLLKMTDKEVSTIQGTLLWFAMLINLFYLVWHFFIR